jgi:hypothetical protein
MDDRCGCGRVGELHHSTAAGRVCCERCHCDAAPPATAVVARPAPRYRPPRPAAYTRVVYRVWEALAAEGRVFYPVPGQLVGWCPACHLGTVTIHIIDGDPPRVRLRPCSDGCTEALIAKAL